MTSNYSGKIEMVNMMLSMVLKVMQDEGRGGITVAKAGIHVRKLCEKSPSRFSECKPEADSPKVQMRKILREFFTKPHMEPCRGNCFTSPT